MSFARHLRFYLILWSWLLRPIRTMPSYKQHYAMRADYFAVNQLLDFQKLQAGKLELEMSPLEVTQFMRVCTDYVLSYASSRAIDFQLTLDGRRSRLPRIWRALSLSLRT